MNNKQQYYYEMYNTRLKNFTKNKVIRISQDPPINVVKEVFNCEVCQVQHGNILVYQHKLNGEQISPTAKLYIFKI